MMVDVSSYTSRELAQRVLTGVPLEREDAEFLARTLAAMRFTTCFTGPT